MIILRVISESHGTRLIKRSQFIADINEARSVIAETSLLGLPFFYEPFRITREEVFGPSGLKKMLDKDNYQLSLLDGKEAPVILDIGSHIGIFPRVIKQKFPLASIYSLEPDRNNFRILKLNNELLTAVESYQCGIYPNKTTLRLKASDLNSWRSSLDVNPSFFRKDLIGDDSFSYDEYDVPCMSIDKFVTERNLHQLNLIGITVPGEIALPILKSASETLVKFKPIVSVSLYTSEQEIVTKFFSTMGYKLHGEQITGMHTFVASLA